MSDMIEELISVFFYVLPLVFSVFVPVMYKLRCHSSILIEC